MNMHLKHVNCYVLYLTQYFNDSKTHTNKHILDWKQYLLRSTQNITNQASETMTQNILCSVNVLKKIKCRKKAQQLECKRNEGNKHQSILRQWI